MSWHDIKGVINPLDPPFSNPADEDASYYEWLAEQEELENEMPANSQKPIYHLLTGISEEELPF